MKAATAACSCLTVAPNVAPPHLAELRRDPSLPASPEVTDKTRSTSGYPFAANARTAEYAVSGPVFAASSSRPVGQEPVVLGSITLSDTAIGTKTSVPIRDIAHLIPPLTLDARAIEISEIGRAVQQECRDRSRMPSSA
eukprot:TRINITY_DN65900_c0_g1_i1.p1 TRINITY_DN65900_c0_g1~~TRINITY_DN65900_c0_g1_i1.p1  ORF type:complete len:139 (-),score=7.47 TRINITY_DN65900_c0_g1_i1:10-426(-)